VSEEVSRKCSARNKTGTTFNPLTPTLSIRVHNVMDRQTDRRRASSCHDRLNT